MFEPGDDLGFAFKAFLELGFTLNCVLKNWFVRTDGKYHDVALMLYGIGKKTELTF